jgi:hypothetical protein
MCLNMTVLCLACTRNEARGGPARRQIVVRFTAKRVDTPRPRTRVPRIARAARMPCRELRVPSEQYSVTYMSIRTDMSDDRLIQVVGHGNAKVHSAAASRDAIA